VRSRSEIARAIQAYLDRHPDASDTAEGIGMWWIPPDWRVDAEDVMAALMQLREQGLVQSQRNNDQHVLFSLPAGGPNAPSRPCGDGRRPGGKGGSD
jgi:hypothetical protein